MKRHTILKLTLALLLFCSGYLFCLLIVKKEPNPIDPTQEKYGKIVSEFMANFENNTLENTPNLISKEFIFENTNGIQYRTKEYISVFGSYRSDFIVAKQRIDSFAVLASPHPYQGKLVAVWFTEQLKKKNEPMRIALFQDIFQFDESDKIKHVKMLGN